ncbi:hypothetical protein V1512DRAFT_258024 [Lipomyces arxii]|uniref:uncharacterized protein n=1 Tax=Lipomyces arxii TaxID=56418 RepID=UPI0034CD5AFA
MKTLILVYVHGFKGDRTTFRDFPSDVQERLQRVYPKTKIVSLIYPPYETKGELSAAVNSFISFLENKTIDEEILNGTASPLMSPTVGFILVAHSMGGLVIADAATQILARDKSITFPKVLGLLCFDSPFLGLHTSVFAQDVVERGSAKFKELKSLSAAVPIGTVASYLFAKNSQEPKKEAGTKDMQQKKASPNWGKIAGIAAAGIVTTAAAAAGTVWYLKSQNMDLNWAKDHLIFVGAIFQKPAVLKERLWNLYQSKDRVQMINYYTVIQPVQSETGSGSNSKFDTTEIVKGLGKIVGGDGDGIRTFCNVPKDVPYSGFFRPAANKKARGEIEAHISIFDSNKNTGYDSLVTENVEIVSGWMANWK